MNAIDVVRKSHHQNKPCVKLVMNGWKIMSNDIRNGNQLKLSFMV